MIPATIDNVEKAESQKFHEEDAAGGSDRGHGGRYQRIPFGKSPGRSEDRYEPVGKLQ